MTHDTEDPQVPLETVYLWLGQPESGDEHLLMVAVNDPEFGVAHRPLMAVTEDAAHGFRDIAQEAADCLRVVAVLREYRVTRITPPAHTGLASVPTALDEVTPS